MVNYLVLGLLPSTTWILLLARWVDSVALGVVTAWDRASVIDGIITPPLRVLSELPRTCSGDRGI